MPTGNSLRAYWAFVCECSKGGIIDITAGEYAERSIYWLDLLAKWGVVKRMAPTDDPDGRAFGRAVWKRPIVARYELTERGYEASLEGRRWRFGLI